MGNIETLKANDLQRISAGTGIVQRIQRQRHGPVHFLQIWIEPAKYSLKPGYEQLSLTERKSSANSAWSHPPRAATEA